MNAHQNITAPPAATKPGGMEARRAEHQSGRADSAKGGRQMGPQVGAPPSLEQVPLDRLHIDPAYQRAVDGAQSRRIIRRMVQEWNWALCQPLSVSRRADGALYVLDGQHRLNGARQRGDIHYLPCVIASNLDLAGEAATFVKLNTERQKLGENDVFMGMLAAGDPDAAQVQDLLTSAGWTMARTKNVKAWKPGQLLCGPMLVRLLKMRGAGPVQFALNVLRAAYPETPVTITATLLAALAELLDDAQSFNAASLVKVMGAEPPLKWLSLRDRHLERFPAMSKQTALAQVLEYAARGEDLPLPAPAPTLIAPTPSTGHPAIAARLAPRPAPVLATKSPFGAEGKGWCDQCQALRSRRHASACARKFCSLRPHA